MKKVFGILLTAILLVACTKDAANNDDGTVKATATFNTIDKHPDNEGSEQHPDTPPTIGVTIGGASYTEYSWEVGDGFAVTSSAGVGASEPEWMFARSAGSTNVHYYGYFDAVATRDTYYAVYPYNSTLVGGNRDHYYEGEFWVDYSVQTGMDRDAALLTAMIKDTTIDELNFDFYPTNAILHVAVNGLPEGESLKSVVLRQTSGESFTTKFQWDILNNRVAGRFSESQITIEHPDDHFFIALPPYLDLSEFSLTFKTNTKEITKVYGARFFEKGYTYRTTIKWEDAIAPTVVCGAKTSYDLYLEGKSDIANKMIDVAVLLGAGFNYDGQSYETESYSTYSNISDDDISSAGVILKNTTTGEERDITLNHGDGYIGRNDWTIADFTVIDWAEYTATAYVILKDGNKIYSEAKHIHVTGFPYDSLKGQCHGFYTTDRKVWTDSYRDNELNFPWLECSNANFTYTNDILWLGHNGVEMNSGKFVWPQMLSPTFHIPEAFKIYANMKGSQTYGFLDSITVSLGLSTPQAGDYQENGSQKHFIRLDLSAGDDLEKTSEQDYIYPDYPCFQIEHESARSTPTTVVHHLRLMYGDK